MTILLTRFSARQVAALRCVVLLATIVGGSPARAQIPVVDGPGPGPDAVDHFEECVKSSECVAHLPPAFAELVRKQQAAEYDRKRALDLAAARNYVAKAGEASAASAPRARRPQ